MAIREIDGHYVISSGGQWLPGAYDTERTARWAFRFPDTVLLAVQEELNRTQPPARRIITAEHLRAARQQLASAPPG